MTEDEFKFALQQVIEGFGQHTVAASKVRSGVGILMAERDTVRAQRDKLRVALLDAINQVEYLHKKFQETGSGNGLVAQWKQLIAEAEKS